MRIPIKSLSFAILTLYTVAACKSDKVGPDAFYGEYQTKFELSFGRENQITTQSGIGYLTVTKVNDSKIAIVESYQNTGREYQATLNGRKFTLNKRVELLTIDGNTEAGVLTGSGEFSKDGTKITLNTSTDFPTSSPFNRIFKVNGTR